MSLGTRTPVSSATERASGMEHLPASQSQFASRILRIFTAQSTCKLFAFHTRDTGFDGMVWAFDPRSAVAPLWTIVAVLEWQNLLGILNVSSPVPRL